MEKGKDLKEIYNWINSVKSFHKLLTCKGQRWSGVLRRGWSVGTGKEAKLLRNHSQLWVLPSHQCFSIPGFLSTPPRCLCFWIPGCFCILTPPCCLCFSIPGCFCFSTLQCCGCLYTSTTSPWFFVGSQGLHIRPLQYSWNENTKAWLLNKIDEDEVFVIVSYPGKRRQYWSEVKRKVRFPGKVRPWVAPDNSEEKHSYRF